MAKLPRHRQDRSKWLRMDPNESASRNGNGNGKEKGNDLEHAMLPIVTTVLLLLLLLPT